MRIDNYNITSDGQQFILTEVKINESIKDGVKSKNFGQEQLVNPKYYTSVKGLLTSISKNELMLLIDELDSVNDVIERFESNLSKIESEISHAIKI